MKRHPKKQARYTKSRSARFVDAVIGVRNDLGSMFYVLALLFTLSIVGGLNYMTSPNEAKAATHNIDDDLPDGISQACWFKILRSYRTRTTMDAYEDAEVIAETARMDRIADTCTDKRFDE